VIGLGLGNGSCWMGVISSGGGMTNATDGFLSFGFGVDRGLGSLAYFFILISNLLSEWI
jgi:hypothetical protein